MATSTMKINYTRGRSEQSEQIIVYLDELGWFQAIPKITYTEFVQFLQLLASTLIIDHSHNRFQSWISLGP
jgi:hypothetical protein